MAGSVGAGLLAGAPWGTWRVGRGLLHPAPREREQLWWGAQFSIRPPARLLPSGLARGPRVSGRGCGCLCWNLGARSCPQRFRADKSLGAWHDLKVTAVLGSRCPGGNRTPAISPAVFLGAVILISVPQFPCLQKWQ